MNWLNASPQGEKRSLEKTGAIFYRGFSLANIKVFHRKLNSHPK